jgi:hypothetical protein
LRQISAFEMERYHPLPPIQVDMIDINEYMKLPLADRQKHLNLKEDCLERGGMSTYFKGMMAHILNTTIPSGMKILVCHACGNAKCSNPNHLYFGSPKENVKDGFNHGTMTDAWQAKINKYGRDEALRMMREHQKKVCGKGTVYITDGITTKRIPKSDPIPANWRLGRTMRSKHADQ